MMLRSEIRRNAKEDMGAVFDRMRKMEETMGDMMEETMGKMMEETMGKMMEETMGKMMEETMGDMKTAVDQILQKLASPEPSLT